MNTDQHITATTRDDLNTIAQYKRRPLDQARHILDIAHAGHQAKRDYLRQIDSLYTDSSHELIEAAFNGRLMAALASLADAYEFEITHA